MAKTKDEPKKPATVTKMAAKEPEPKETYQVVRRGDTYVVEANIYGRMFHDTQTFPHEEDAKKRLEELKGK